MGLDAVTLAVGKSYTNKKIKEILGGVSEDLDTFKEVSDALKKYGTPAVDENDNGKFLCVVDGSWQATTIPEAESDKF